MYWFTKEITKGKINLGMIIPVPDQLNRKTFVKKCGKVIFFNVYETYELAEKAKELFTQYINNSPDYNMGE